MLFIFSLLILIGLILTHNINNEIVSSISSSIAVNQVSDDIAVNSFARSIAKNSPSCFKLIEGLGYIFSIIGIWLSFFEKSKKGEKIEEN